LGIRKGNMNKRRMVGLLLGSLMAAALSVGVVSTAQAASGYHELVNVATQKCADVSGGSTRPGALIHEWDCVGDDNQLWGLADLGNGYYNLVNKNSHLCAELPNDSGANGTPIEQEDCLGYLTEQWELRNLYNNPQPNYILVNRFTGKCLDLRSASARNGTQIQIWDCANLNAQFPNLPGIPAQVWAVR
jgi:hypothetical protein